MVERDFHIEIELGEALRVVQMVCDRLDSMEKDGSADDQTESEAEIGDD